MNFLTARTSSRTSSSRRGRIPTAHSADATNGTHFYVWTQALIDSFDPTLRNTKGIKAGDQMKMPQLNMLLLDHARAGLLTLQDTRGNDASGPHNQWMKLIRVYSMISPLLCCVAGSVFAARETTFSAVEFAAPMSTVGSVIPDKAMRMEIIGSALTDHPHMQAARFDPESNHTSTTLGDTYPTTFYGLGAGEVYKAFQQYDEYSLGGASLFTAGGSLDQFALDAARLLRQPGTEDVTGALYERIYQANKILDLPMSVPLTYAEMAGDAFDVLLTDFGAVYAATI